ncbi:hypothetical protein Droror1_Dr00015122 [Drosera rotundifolia]
MAALRETFLVAAQACAQGNGGSVEETQGRRLSKWWRGRGSGFEGSSGGVVILIGVQWFGALVSGSMLVNCQVSPGWEFCLVFFFWSKSSSFLSLVSALLCASTVLHSLLVAFYKDLIAFIFLLWLLQLFVFGCWILSSRRDIDRNATDFVLSMK